MSDDIFRPGGGAASGPSRTPGDSTINEAGTDGFAIDGTDAFAIDEHAVVELGDPGTEPVADEVASARGSFAVTIAAAVVGLLIVIVVGSSTGPRPAVGGADRMRGEEVEEGSEAPTSDVTTDDSEPVVVVRDERAVTSRVDPRSSDLTVTSEDDVTFDEGTSEFDDEFAFDDEFDDGFDDEFDDPGSDFDDDDGDQGSGGSGRQILTPRRPAVTAPGRPRVTLPPRTTTTEPDDEDPDPTTTTVAATTTTVEATTTTAATTTTTTTTVPPPVWTAATTGLPATCSDGLQVWSRTNGVVASVRGQGLFTSADRGLTWTNLGGAPLEPRAFVQHPTAPDTFWIAGADRVLRGEQDGGRFVPLGALPAVRSLSVAVSAAAPDTLLAVAGTGATSTLQRSTDDGASWTDITAQLPSGVGTIGDPLLIDAAHAVLGTSAGVYRTADGGATWTPAPGSAGVVGAPVRASNGTIYWLAAAGGVISSTDGGQTWSPAVGAATPVAKLAQLADGRLLAVGATTLVASGDGGATWAPFGPSLPTGYAPAGVAHSTAAAATFIWRTACAADAVLRLADA